MQLLSAYVVIRTISGRFIAMLKSDTLNRVGFKTVLCGTRIGTCRFNAIDRSGQSCDFGWEWIELDWIVNWISKKFSISTLGVGQNRVLRIVLILHK